MVFAINVSPLKGEQHKYLSPLARYTAFNSLLHQTKCLQPASCAFILDQSPWAGKKHTHTHTLTCLSTHRHALTQPTIISLTMDTHTQTHQNDMVAQLTIHQSLSQPLSNTHHKTGRTVTAWLLGVAGCHNCNRWNCSSMADRVKESWVNTRVCKCIFAGAYTSLSPYLFFEWFFTNPIAEASLL